MNPRSVDKGIAVPGDRPRATGCPWINLNESAGADLPHQADIFIRGGGRLQEPDAAVASSASRTITVGVRPEHGRRRVHARA